LGRSVASICRLFGFYPIVATVKSRITMVGVFGGSIENAWTGVYALKDEQKGDSGFDTSNPFLEMLNEESEQQ